MFFSSASPCFFPVMIFFCSSPGIFQQNSVYSNTWLPQDNSLVLPPIRYGTRMTPHLAFAGQVSLLALNEMGRYRSYRTSGVLPTYLCQAAWKSVSQITQFFLKSCFLEKHAFAAENDASLTRSCLPGTFWQCSKWLRVSFSRQSPSVSNKIKLFLFSETKAKDIFLFNFP